jgi:hypothetical protein
MVFAVMLLTATRSAHIMRVGFSIIVILRFACLCLGESVVETSFLLFEARLFDSDVLNVVLSDILDIVRRIDVK